LIDFLQSRPHTRIPVYENSLDEIVGIVNSKDLEHLINSELAQELEEVRTVISSKSGGQHVLESNEAAEEKLLDLTPVVSAVAVVPETIRIDRLLTELKKQRQQIAIVIDEYGGTVGLVTLVDLLEQVFGDLPDEEDVETEPEILQQPDGSIQVAGSVNIDEVNELFGFGFPTDEAVTMAGLVVNALGRIASAGDEVKINHIRIRVEQVDRFRVTSLNLVPPTGKPAEASPSDNAE
jgi:CBS domain containing-hemolysin-like protein